MFFVGPLRDFFSQLEKKKILQKFEISSNQQITRRDTKSNIQGVFSWVKQIQNQSFCTLQRLKVDKHKSETIFIYSFGSKQDKTQGFGCECKRKSSYINQLYIWKTGFLALSYYVVESRCHCLGLNSDFFCPFRWRERKQGVFIMLPFVTCSQSINAQDVFKNI